MGAGLGTEYGQAFALWRDKAAGPWRDYSRHAFVQGVRDGSLPRSAFLHYLRQDYVFLIHFARAWALAAAKAETLEEMKSAAATVHALVHHEMQLHIDTCAGEGISQAELEATPEGGVNIGRRSPASGVKIARLFTDSASDPLAQMQRHIMKGFDLEEGSIGNAEHKDDEGTIQAVVPHLAGCVSDQRTAVASGFVEPALFHARAWFVVGTDLSEARRRSVHTAGYRKSSNLGAI